MTDNYMSWILAGVLLLCGCGRPMATVAPESSRGAELVPVEVSGEQALEEVRRFVALGPRLSGTKGAERAALYLADRLQELGVETEIQEFSDASPKGTLVFRNVLGRIPGTGKRILLLGSHYDTKVGIADDFAGANDSGSSTGLLLELARAFQATAPHPMEIRLAFFDGEESMKDYGPTDGLHGSRYLAQHMEAEGRLADIEAMILLDMIGDRNLTVTIPRNSAPPLVNEVFNAARAEGVRRYFQLYPAHILDDHVPFLERGVLAINLIDFQFGSEPGRNDYWHTPDDTMDKLSAESLDIVGRVTARVVAQLMQATPK
ncbi:MAG: M28 family peptidase [Kiritimatiellia bacterium]|nr:M28 family peptidase [Kiritimatiellia bacterium]